MSIKRGKRSEKGNKYMELPLELPECGIWKVALWQPALRIQSFQKKRKTHPEVPGKEEKYVKGKQPELRKKK